MKLPIVCGIAMGGDDRLVLFDFDTDKRSHTERNGRPLTSIKDSIAWKRAADAIGLHKIEAAWTALTASGGDHLIFRTPPGYDFISNGDVLGTKSIDGVALDIKANGGFAVAYAPINKFKDTELDPTNLPELTLAELAKLGRYPKGHKSAPEVASHVEQKAGINVNIPSYMREMQAEVGASTLHVSMRNSLEKWKKTLEEAAPSDITPKMKNAGVLDLNSNEGFEVVVSCMASAVRDDHYNRDEVWQILDAHCQKFKGYDVVQNRKRFDSFIDSDYEGDRRTFGTLKRAADVAGIVQNEAKIAFFSDIPDHIKECIRKRDRQQQTLAENLMKDATRNAELIAEIDSEENLRTEALSHITGFSSATEAGIAELDQQIGSVIQRAIILNRQKEIDYRQDMHSAISLSEVKDRYVFIKNWGGHPAVYDRATGEIFKATQFKQSEKRPVDLGDGKLDSKLLGPFVVDNHVRWRLDIADRTECAFHKTPGVIYPRDSQMILNIFGGWDIDSASVPFCSDALWEILEFYINKVVGQGGKKEAKYLWNFMAWCLRNPEKKPGVLLSFIGGQGTGKSTFGEILSALFAPFAVKLSCEHELLGDFGISQIEKARVVMLEEFIFTGNKDMTAKLKHVITSDTLLCNPKGVQAYNIQSRHIFVHTSNSLKAVPVEAGDRRYMVISVETVPGWEPTSPKWGELRQADGRIRMDLIKRLKDYLLNQFQLDESWHPRQLVNTVARQAQKTMHLSIGLRIAYDMFTQQGSAARLVSVLWPRDTDVCNTLSKDEIEAAVFRVNEIRGLLKQRFDADAHEVWTRTRIARDFKQFGVTSKTIRVGKGTEKVWVLPPYEEAKKLFFDGLNIDPEAVENL